jgi:ABC-type phosphate transport system substrate-binding protein
MKLQSSTRRFLDTASVLVLSTAAFLASSGTPASAQATNGVYAGGSTLASEAFRQIFDCYTGATVGGDNFTFSSGFNPATPTPGLLPTTCTVTSTVQGMYAGVGSGNGVRGYISNRAEQWYGGTLTPSTTTDIAISTPFPSGQPPFVDSSNSTNFGSYPYPRVDIGLSDAPLASIVFTTATSTTIPSTLTTIAFSLNPSTAGAWASGGVTTSTTQITLQSTTQQVTYNAGSWGNPVQLPAFEVPVAIPMNVNSTLFTINSQIKNSSGNIVQGGAIQLTEGQLCAIFSGLVTDWHDSTTQIAELNSSGTQLFSSGTTPVVFDHANVGSVTTPGAYASASLPITVVFRSDGSGTSFILTNYLANVCPLLDPTDTYKYQSIFVNGPKKLPSTSFSDLIANITAARGAGPWSTTAATQWVGASGSGGVQAAVGVTSTQAGRIGYLSNDFVKPYAVNTQAPNAASLQDEAQRIAGTYVPGTSTTAPSFIVPTPAGANNAWADSALTVPTTTTSTTQTYFENWNVYGINYPATEPSTNHGGLAVAGHSVLALTNHASAYPLSGTTFLMLYSCYGNATNGPNLINFVTWFYETSTSNPKVAQILANNGFAPLNNTTWLARLQNVYLKAGSSFQIATIGGSSTNGCTGVTGGANP